MEPFSDEWYDAHPGYENPKEALTAIPSSAPSGCSTYDVPLRQESIDAEDNELGVRLLDFLRDIHEQECTPESRDVDDLLTLISQYV